MASQITHIVLADKVFARYFSRFDKRDFYIGTVFPDIRYLGGVDRNQTHVYEITLTDVQNETNPFEAGRKFHSLVDLVRDDFVSGRGIYELVPNMEGASSVPKLLEDEFFYPHANSWAEIIGYFDAVLPEELGYQISRERIEKWHGTMQEYFAGPPTEESRFTFATGLGIGEEEINRLNAAVETLRRNPEACKILQGLYDGFENILERWVI